MYSLENKKRLLCKSLSTTYGTVTTHESRPSLKSEYIRKIATDACLIGRMPTPSSCKIPPGLLKNNECMACTYTASSGYNCLKSYPYSEYKICACTQNLRHSRHKSLHSSCRSNSKIINEHRLIATNSHSNRYSVSSTSGQHGLSQSSRQFNPLPNLSTPHSLCNALARLTTNATKVPFELAKIQSNLRIPQDCESNKKQNLSYSKNSNACHHCIARADLRHSYPSSYHNSTIMELHQNNKNASFLITRKHLMDNQTVAPCIRKSLKYQFPTNSQHFPKPEYYKKNLQVSEKQQQQSLPLLDPRGFEAYAALLKEVHIR